MRIDNSTVYMSGKSDSIIENNKSESLKIWIGNRGTDSGRKPAISAAIPLLQADILELSQEGRDKLLFEIDGNSCVEETGEIELEYSEEDKNKLLLLQGMIETLTGKKIKFHIPDKIKFKRNIGADIPHIRPMARNVQAARGWGLEYDYNETHHEKQNMEFSSNGIVRTADGREIEFSCKLNMSREFYSSNSISIRAGDALLNDPLVINYGGSEPELTEKEFIFDIDCDGTEDMISFLKEGSGFLAFDKNGDGLVNTGNELFGPQSGNGFEELAAFDSDNNNWIDENDPIYEKLAIWSKDENGNDKLLALGQVGVGAIYLGNVSTAFDLKNSSNELQGIIQSTGIFLREDGTAGSIQHIDLAI
jgi:hypothetical protein